MVTNHEGLCFINKFRQGRLSCTIVLLASPWKLLYVCRVCIRACGSEWVKRCVWVCMCLRECMHTQVYLHDGEQLMCVVVYWTPIKWGKRSIIEENAEIRTSSFSLMSEGLAVYSCVCVCVCVWVSEWHMCEYACACVSAYACVVFVPLLSGVVLYLLR